MAGRRGPHALVPLALLASVTLAGCASGGASAHKEAETGASGEGASAARLEVQRREVASYQTSATQAVLGASSAASRGTQRAFKVHVREGQGVPAGAARSRSARAEQRAGELAAERAQRARARRRRQAGLLARRAEDIAAAAARRRREDEEAAASQAAVYDKTLPAPVTGVVAQSGGAGSRNAPGGSSGRQGQLAEERSKERAQRRAEREARNQPPPPGKPRYVRRHRVL